MPRIELLMGGIPKSSHPIIFFEYPPFVVVVVVVEIRNDRNEILVSTNQWDLLGRW